MNWQALIAQVEHATAHQQWQALADVDDICRAALQHLSSDTPSTPTTQHEDMPIAEHLALLQLRYCEAVDTLRQAQQQLQQELQGITTGRKASAAYLNHS
jgi:hypothetical protein